MNPLVCCLISILDVNREKYKQLIILTPDTYHSDTGVAKTDWEEFRNTVDISVEFIKYSDFLLTPPLRQFRINKQIIRVGDERLHIYGSSRRLSNIASYYTNGVVSIYLCSIECLVNSQH